MKIEAQHQALLTTAHAALRMDELAPSREWVRDTHCVCTVARQVRSQWIDSPLSGLR